MLIDSDSKIISYISKSLVYKINIDKDSHHFFNNNLIYNLCTYGQSYQIYWHLNDSFLNDINL